MRVSWLFFVQHNHNSELLILIAFPYRLLTQNIYEPIIFQKDSTHLLILLASGNIQSNHTF